MSQRVHLIGGLTSSFGKLAPLCISADERKFSVILSEASG